MIRRASLVASCLMLFAVFSAAEAAWTRTALHLRTGPGTRYAVITTMPAGAYVDLIRCGSWCELYYQGRRGFASARLISLDGYRPAPRVIALPMPPVIYWQYGQPWWDDRHHSWYEGRRWWYNDSWHRRPRSTIYFEFRF